MGSRRSIRAGRSRLRVIERLRDASGSTASAEAREAARHLLSRDRGDDELRHALAEHCRARGARAQAARWGITTPGWAEASEIRDLRRWLLGRGDDSDVVRDHLLLAPDRSLPAELVDLVPPSLREPRTDPPPSSGSSCWWFLLAVVATVIGIACGATVLVQAAAGDVELVSSARTSAVVGGLAWAMASTARWPTATGALRPVSHCGSRRPGIVGPVRFSFALGCAGAATRRREGFSCGGRVTIAGRTRRDDGVRRSMVQPPRASGRRTRHRWPGSRVRCERGASEI